MGYRDDFYTLGNIVGYTGQLNDFPTVYFQTAALRGHITQRHGYVQNVGRQAVASAVGYWLGNERVRGGEMKLVEKQNGVIFHESRSTLTRVDPNSFETVDFEVLGILAQAIRNNPNEKNISSFSVADQHEIQASERKLQHVLGALQPRY